MRPRITAAKLSVLSFAMLTASAATAVPTSYSFTTGSNPFGTAASLFAPGDSVSGTFTYDPDSPATGTAGLATVYIGSLTNLSGSVAGLSFSDPSGRTLVRNDISDAVSDSLDLTADPFFGISGTRDLSGFAVGGFTLNNVRLFWIEGVLGAPDFLDSNALPDALPQFPGRLALDFVPTASPTAVSFAFFDGLIVQQVPEPGVLWLLAFALLCLALLRRDKSGARRPPLIATTEQFAMECSRLPR